MENCEIKKKLIHTQKNSFWYLYYQEKKNHELDLAVKSTEIPHGNSTEKSACSFRKHHPPQPPMT